MFATAHCEFHSLIFLFISETEEAFFNKTTENMSCVLFFYCWCHLIKVFRSKRADQIKTPASSPCMKSKFLYTAKSWKHFCEGDGKKYSTN